MIVYDLSIRREIRENLEWFEKHTRESKIREDEFNKIMNERKNGNFWGSNPFEMKKDKDKPP